MTVTQVDLDTTLLRARLDDGWHESRRTGQSILVSQAQRVDAGDHLGFFARGRSLAHDRLAWASPDNALVLTGVGAEWTLAAHGSTRFADAAAAWRTCRTGALVDAPADRPGVGPILIGGFAFDPLQASGRDWRDFPDGLLVLPRYLLTTVHGETWFTITILLTPESDPAAEADAVLRASEVLLAPASDAPPTTPMADRVQREDAVSAAVWQDAVRALAAAVQRGDLEKVVLARECRLHAPRAFDPAAVLRRVWTDVPNSFRFAVTRGDRCFLGASPEQLVKLRDQQVATVALAGSIRRGATAEEDRELGEALVQSAKDQVEHAVVVRAVRAALADLGTDLTPQTVPTLLKLPNVQHLRTLITTNLTGEHTIFDLLARLHPTPAVGGAPREAAVRLIREYEPFARGWYAGPIGWVDAADEGEFAVAIRSARLDGQDAALFAGCGIVGASDPEREYAEAELKFRAMLNVLVADTPLTAASLAQSNAPSHPLREPVAVARGSAA